MRSFSRLYNEIKHKPRAYERIPENLKSSLRFTQNVRLAHRTGLKALKRQLPHVSLSNLAKASKQQIKAFYKIPSLSSPNDPSLEKPYRRALIKQGINPAVEEQKEYLQENLFLLDKSVESRRNVLLAQETEAFEKALRAHKEQQRIEEVRKRDPRVILGTKYTGNVNIDQLLDGVEVEETLPAMPSPNRVSEKGVVHLKTADPSELDQTTASNYICFNLLSSEEAIGFAQKFQMNPSNSVLFFSKLATFSDSSQHIESFHDLLKELNTSSLTKKETCDLIWSLGNIYQHKTSFLKRKIEPLVEQFKKLIPQCNSMNLAYATEGLKKLQVLDEDLLDRVLTRTLQIAETVTLPETPLSINPSVYNPKPSSHSLYSGFTDLTIPRYSLPSFPLVKILDYLQSSPRASPLTNYLFVRAAVIINYLGVPELDTKGIVQAIDIFGNLPEGVAHREEVKEVMDKLVTRASDIEYFPLNSVWKLGKSLMNTGGFSYGGFFRKLEHLAVEGIGIQQEAQDLLKVTEVMTRYYIATTYGRDLQLEPFLWTNFSPTLRSAFHDRLFSLLDSIVDPIIFSRLAYYLVMLGYPVKPLYHPNPYALVVAYIKNQPSFLIENLHKLSKQVISNCETIQDFSYAAVGFSVLGLDFEKEFFKEFYLKNQENFPELSYKIAFAWALKDQVTSDFESVQQNLLTKTDKTLLSQISNSQ